MGLYGLYKVGGLHQGLMGSGIKPGKALAQERYVQLAVFQVNTV